MSKLTKRQLKEEFNKFLRENDCASKFYVNFYRPESKEWRNVYRLTYKFDYEAIINAFNWRRSTEGFQYWGKISDSWIAKYKELTA
jgi:hypothetical protein